MSDDERVRSGLRNFSRKYGQTSKRDSTPKEAETPSSKPSRGTVEAAPPPEITIQTSPDATRAKRVRVEDGRETRPMDPTSPVAESTEPSLNTESPATEERIGEIKRVKLDFPSEAIGADHSGVTAYHAKYFAHFLTKRAPGGNVERLSQSLFNASIDLQPHQVEAALFALRSPLSKGSILGDEVGLGKTIEAGLVLCQYWAERRRRLLVLCPASLRKQWQLELSTKFSLPSIVLDGKEFKNLQKQGYANPWQQDAIVIASYPYAANQSKELTKVPWDLAVLDEAHRLRNPKAKTSERLQAALSPVRKLLLTATPLQNHIMELHTLATMIDDKAFGDAESFRAQYAYRDADFEDLKVRLEPVVCRTLRRDVKEYVNYTERLPITIEFDPPENEVALYEGVSEFLQREDTYALPKSQRHLLLLILRKILASSSPALASTLERIRGRLDGKLAGHPQSEPDWEQILDDEVLDDEELEEAEPETGEERPFDPAACRGEIEELNEFIRMAHAIKTDEKSHALLRGLNQGFQKMSELGAKRKALVFTESRRTQTYLKNFLEANGYENEVVLFNGTNTEPESRDIYDRWLAKNKPLGRTSGNRAIDIRTALMEHFRDQGTVMLATEAAGEGVNLQFCSLVVNYDLPWNPQRVEQRIGRCHRYGQEHDVVVVNFLNLKNEADARVLELLSEKFHLFQGVFGSSDEVLGTLASGVDFEKQILGIYQRCRDPEDIRREFDQLQQEMETSIKSRMADVRQKLLEHFDEEVHNRFKNFLADTQKHLDHIERMFWSTTKHVLHGDATFDDEKLEFELTRPVGGQLPAGRFQLIDRTEGGRLRVDENDILYRMSHPLGEHVLDTAKATRPGIAHVRFDITNHHTKISVVEELKGTTGWLAGTKLTLTAYAPEEFVILTGITDDGISVEPEVLQKLWNVGGSSRRTDPPDPGLMERLEGDVAVHVQATVHEAMARNEDYFAEEQDRLERWAQDLITSAERDLDDVRKRIDEFARLARQATNLPAKMEAMKQQRDEERKLQNAQRRVWEAQDEIRARRDQFIDELKARLQQDTSIEPLFVVRWEVA